MTVAPSASPQAALILLQFGQLEKEVAREIQEDQKPSVTMQAEKVEWYRKQIQDLRGMWSFYQDYQTGPIGDVDPHFATRVTVLETQLGPWFMAFPEAVSPVLNRSAPVTNGVPALTLPPRDLGNDDVSIRPSRVTPLVVHTKPA